MRQVSYVCTLVLLSLAVTASAQLVTGVTATASSRVSVDTDAMAAVNGAGTWNFGGTTGYRHQNVDWGGWMWMSGPSLGQEWINLHLPTAAHIGELEIWNLSQILPGTRGVPGDDIDLGRSAKNVTISYSTDGVNYSVWGSLTLNRPVTDLEDSSFWYEHSGGVSYWFAPTDVIDLGGVLATDIKITTLSVADGGNYGDSQGYRGLAEVRVYAVPEPLTLSLLGLGGLLIRKRK